MIQQLRNVFPYDTAPRYLVFDRDSIFSEAVVYFIKSMGTSPVRTSFRSPWQNGTAERWIGSCRREMLDHVVVLSERHFVRLARSYIDYLSRGSLSPGTRQRFAERETGHAATVTDRKNRCASESGRAAPSLRMARGSLEQFSAAKGRVTGALEVYVVQRTNPFAVRSLNRPGCVDLVFGRSSSSRMASRSGGLVMRNDRLRGPSLPRTRTKGPSPAAGSLMFAASVLRLTFHHKTV